MKILKHSVLLGALLAASCITTVAEAKSYSLSLTPIGKTMSDGTCVNFWVYGGTLPGPKVEIGIGETLNISFNMSMGNGCGGTQIAPQEMNTPYTGHTIHMHGADVNTANDGVPETTNSNGAPNGSGNASYVFTPAANMAGSMMYHCHVHTVKHLEMGLYGALIVKPMNAAKTAYLNQLTADTATAFDYEQIYLFSTVDPAYHTATGDSTVFADYNPKYFMISGNESATKTVASTVPAITLAAAVNKKVALRLVGLQGVNATFSIRDKNDSTGAAKPFTVYVEDARKLPTALTNQTSLDVAPGQRFDIIFNTPSTSGTWYPQVTYKKLRDGTALNTTYGKVTF